MQLFDSHCHLQDSRLDKDRDQLIQRASNLGINRIAIKSSVQNDWSIVKKLCLKNNFFHSSFGLHPWFLSKRTSAWLNDLEEILLDNPSSGVGEIGIDANPKGNLSISIEEQEGIFIDQLILAKKLRRPASIHCRGPWNRLLALLDQVGELPGGFMIHCYGGSLEIAQNLITRGAYLSFSGTITRPNNLKASLVLSQIPAERILIETDAPDLTPYNLKKELNEPANLIYVLEKAAEFRGESIELLAEQTYTNACRLFNIVNT